MYGGGGGVLFFLAVYLLEKRFLDKNFLKFTLYGGGGMVHLFDTLLLLQCLMA